MPRRAVLIALACLAACGGGGDAPRGPETPGGDGPPVDPGSPATPGTTLSPAVAVSGTPAPPPACSLARAADAPDTAAAPASSLAPAWTIAPPEGWLLGFDGISDAEGNVYWHEWRPDGVGALASSTRDGAVRWRAERGGDARAWLVAAGRVLAAIGADFSFPDRVEALDAATGTVAWTLDVQAVAAALVPAQRGPARPGARVDHPSVLDGLATFPIAVVDGPGYTWPGLLRVELATGRVVELRAIATDLTIWIPSEPAATAGETFAVVRPTETTAALLAFDGGGAARVAKPLRAEDDLWTLGASERFVLDLGRDESTYRGFVQWSALDGTPRGRVAADGTPELVATGGSAFLHALGRVARVDLDGCAIAWERTVLRAPAGDRWTRYAVATTAPFLTAGGGVLLAAQLQRSDGTSTGTAGEGAWVVELAADGREAYRGRLPDGVLYGGGAALRGGRFVTATYVPGGPHRLVAFDLAGQEPAASGWVTQHGSPSRERRARTAE